jgi:hypothetical protein
VSGSCAAENTAFSCSLKRAFWQAICRKARCSQPSYIGYEFWNQRTKHDNSQRRVLSCPHKCR